MKNNNHLRCKIKVSAPGKLMLFGEHAVVYGLPCIVTAVDQRMRVEIELSNDKLIRVSSPDVGIDNLELKLSDNLKNIPKGAKFVFTSIKNFYKKYNLSSGLIVKTKSDFSSSFGFGSSSAVTVCIVKALSELFGKKMGRKQLFDICFQTVLEVQGVGSGFDIASAIWGGTIYFIGGGKKILPISTKSVPIVVGYTGIKADTSDLVNKVALLRRDQPETIKLIFSAVSMIVKKARKAMEINDFKSLGRLADMNQGLLDSLGVSTQKLNDLIFSSRMAGAYGAKLSGAGGGDCMIAFYSKNNLERIRDSIKKAGGIFIPVKTSAEGVRIER